VGPSPAEHRRQAHHNEEFARFLGGPASKWKAWTMVAVFYAALHYIQAFLVEQGHRPEEHSERNALLRNWPNIKVPYMRLYAWSMDSRYRCYPPNEKRLEYAFGLLEDIKKETDAHSASPGH
jgi:hypothetical protein